MVYAPKVEPDEGRLDWNRPAVELERLVRGLAPAPGAWCVIEGEGIKVARAALVQNPAVAPPGTVLDEQLAVACGEGALRLLTVQRAGRARMETEAFLRDTSPKAYEAVVDRLLASPRYG